MAENWEGLFDGVLLRIVKFLDRHSLLGSFCCVCQRWRKVALSTITEVVYHGYMRDMKMEVGKNLAEDLTFLPNLEKFEASLVFFPVGLTLPSLVKRTIFSMCDFPSLDTIRCLPEHVYLNFSRFEPSQDRMTNIISTLPRTVCKLELYFASSFNDTAIKHLPPALQELHVDFGKNISDNGIADLPRALTKLAILMETSVTEAGLKLLPPNLQELRIDRIRFTEEGASALPSTLQRLVLSSGDHLNDSAIAKLPRSLQDLELGFCFQLTDRCISLLPPGLKRLHLSYAQNLTTSALTDLPASLTYLCFRWCSGIDTTTFNSLPIPNLEYFS